MAKEPSNKLSIYLIKKEYSEPDEILKNIDNLDSISIPEAGEFYFGESHNFQPTWVKKFFKTTLDGNSKIFSASAKGLLLVELDINSEKRIFAISFGYGWLFLNPGVFEERFGLKTALSIIDSNNLRKIDKKNMITIPKDTSEQLSKAGIAADFGIDIEQDLIRSVTGKSINENMYGRTLTGKDSLTVSVKINITSIKDFLKLCYEKYLSDEYKNDFGWIDHIADIKDVSLMNELNSKLIENIKNNALEKTWMAVPEIIEWERVSGFKYSQAKGEEPREDINIDSFLDSLPDDQKESLSIEYLKRKGIYCIDAQNDQPKHNWNAFNCLYCELQDDEKLKTYLLSNGKWYEIESVYAQEVNADFEAFRNAGSTLTLPAYNHGNENEYNKTIAAGDCDNLHCMDCDCISHGGAHSKIEFCDLMSKDKKFIHVKHYGGSSVLSHLFSQGLVAGELFLRDAKFRTKVNEKLPNQFKISNPNQKQVASQFEIIYGIISSYQRDLELPFFSKVSLRTAKNRLETFGYKVSLLKIPKIDN